MPRPRRVSARNAARGARSLESPNKNVVDKPVEPQQDNELEAHNESDQDQVLEMEVDPPPEIEAASTEPEPTPEAAEKVKKSEAISSELTVEPLKTNDETETNMEINDDEPPEETDPVVEFEDINDEACDESKVETNDEATPATENSTEPAKVELVPKEDQPAEEDIDKKPDVTTLEDPKVPEEQPKLATRLLRARRKPRVEISEEEDIILMRDEAYLIDVSLGYGPADNLKEPLKGFTPDDEVKLFPVIDSMSSKLFTIVQKMTDDQKRDIEAACIRRKGVIKICDFPKAFLYHLKYRDTPPDADKTNVVKRAPHPFLTEDENIFSEEKLKILRAVLDAGWKREVVMRSPNASGRKTGDVYYYSPSGTKYRSSKQIAQHLAQHPDSPFTVENFSFAKVRISTNPDQEIVRKAYDGKSPPRAQPKGAPPKAKSPQPTKTEAPKPVAKPSSSKDTTESESRPVEEPVKAAAGRRSIQPPKRYSGDAVLLLPKRSKTQDDKYRSSNSNKGLMQMGMLPPKYPKGMEDSSSNLTDMDESMKQDIVENSLAPKELAEDSLFAISALRQSGRIDVDKMRQYVESQKLAAEKAATNPPATSNDIGTHHRMIAAGRTRKNEEVIPCSIRCPGMTGEIPNLQCTRCLCLYHAHCLGLPPNLSYNNFLCSNCEGQGEQPSTSGSGTSQEMKKPMLMKKPTDMKRQPPPLIRATSLRGGAPRRDVMIAPVSRREPTRVPQKVVVPVQMGRGIMRGRGMAAPLTRSPSTFVHPGQHRISAPDGSPGAVVGSSHGTNKRGRGRSTATRPLPQLNSKSLTITHLPRILPKPPAGPLPVPNLQPMSAPKGVPAKIAIPVLPVKPRQSMPVVPNLMKSNAFKLTVPPPSLSGRTFKKVPQAPTHPTNLRLNPSLVHRPSSQIYAQGQDKSVSLIKRHPQSVVSVGPKKFIVLPRKSRSEFISSASNPNVVGNGVSTRINNVAEARSETKKVSSPMCDPNNDARTTTTVVKVLVPSDNIDLQAEPMETETNAAVNNSESECMDEDDDSAKLCIDSADFAKPGTEQATVSNE